MASRTLDTVPCQQAGWGGRSFTPAIQHLLLSSAGSAGRWKINANDIYHRYPYGAYYGLILCIVLIIVQFYLSVWPLGGSPSAKGFFANYVSVILIVVMWLGARLYYRGRWWVDLDTIDLDAGRRFYNENDAEKVPIRGFVGAVKKGAGFVFN